MSGLKIHAEPEGPPVYLRLVDGEWLTTAENRPVTLDDWKAEIGRLDVLEGESEALRAKDERPLSSLGIEHGHIRAKRKPRPEKVSCPADTVIEIQTEDRRRFRFLYLLGTEGAWNGPESLWVWGGEAWACLFCGHLPRLPRDTACLNPDCCRTGMDHKIGRPTPMDMARLAAIGPTRYVAPVGVKGGRG